MIKFMIAVLLTGTYGAIPFILDGYLNPESGKFIIIAFFHYVFFITFSIWKHFQNQIIKKFRLMEMKKRFFPNFTNLSIIITTRNNPLSSIKSSCSRFTLYLSIPVFWILEWFINRIGISHSHWCQVTFNEH